MALIEGLTLKQKGFADDYLQSGNGIRSAINNYDTTDPNVAGAIASENLRKPKVEAYIAKKMNARELNREFVVTRLLDELDNDEAQPVVRVKVLELLGKALRMFSEKQVDENDLTRIKAISWGKPKETVKPIPEDNEPIEIKAE
jgi:hypothetical protein